VKRWNRLLVLAIIVVLLVPAVVVGTLLEACCGVVPIDLLVDDAPDPACVSEDVTISGTYTVVPGENAGYPWYTYDTGVVIKVWDCDGEPIVDEELTVASGVTEPDPLWTGTGYSFSYTLHMDCCGTYTYEVTAWSVTIEGRMETHVVGGTIEVLCGECPTIDCLVEKEIRDRWDDECPSCDEAKNHGAYVSCRAKIVSEYVEMGLVDEEGSSCLINPVARTDCGKEKGPKK
jgi:hypothetical protein